MCLQLMVHVGKQNGRGYDGKLGLIEKTKKIHFEAREELVVGISKDEGESIGQRGGSI